MARRFYRDVRPSFDGPRVNERIRVPNVRVIADDGSQAGILSIEDAIELARSSGLDLVEVAPQADPPVCRVMDFGKYKYEQKKRQNEARKKQTIVEVKEIKIRPKTDSHDIEFKFKKARGFLEEGNKVKLTVRFRGREIIYADEEQVRLKTLSEKYFTDIAEIDQTPKREGRTVVMILAPMKKGKKPNPNPKAKAEKPEPDSKETKNDG